MYQYFVSYVFKKRFGNWGYGCCCLDSNFPINADNLFDFCHELAKVTKAKKVIILNYKELPAEKEVSGDVS